MRMIVDSSDMVRKCTHLTSLVYMQTEIAADHLSEGVEKLTFPSIPRREGYLEGSFKPTLLVPPPILEMLMTWDAVSNRGFHYAEIQEITESFKHKKGTAHYARKGVESSKAFAEIIYGQHIQSVL